MSTISTEDPEIRSALVRCVSTLRRVADYQLAPALDQRMSDLGERKEYLGQPEYDELMAPVAFSQQRTIEKLEAELALKRLGEILPEVVSHD